jgi:hypothetical protein
VSLWPIYDAIGCPTLLVRGAESDLLTRETADEMGQRGPGPAGRGAGRRPRAHADGCRPDRADP